jgi:hypothetical protein
MTTEQKHLVADELNNSGFKVSLSKVGVIVSLDNRKVRRIEVEWALIDLFEGISFTIKSLSDSVLVA